MGDPRLTPGRRNKRIVFERTSAGADGFGHATVAPRNDDLARVWANILFGSGSEQREAAQQGGAQTATFLVLADSETVGVSVRDHVLYPLSDPDPDKWPSWEIQAVAEVGLNEGFAFTATRVAG